MSPQPGDILFFDSGIVMLYLGGDNAVGMLPEGAVTKTGVIKGRGIGFKYMGYGTILGVRLGRYDEAGTTRQTTRAATPGRETMSKTQPTWPEEVDKRHDVLVALRRDFHRHPELSFEERRTSEIIAERLHAAGLEVRTAWPRPAWSVSCGATAPAAPWRGGPTLDALPLTETLEAPFASGAPGVMHACGHDGHTAIAITLAEIFAARRRELPGTAVFLFQPAEEILGGAKPMIEAGVLDDPHVEQVYGLHLTTTAPAGYVTARPGPAMASADGFTVEVRGRGGHGAMPHLSVDPITTAANILLGMQNLVSREVPAQETAVLTIGQLVSGTKSNIIPDRAFMTGTLRAFDEGVRRQILGRLEDYVSHIGQAYRTQATLKVDLGSCPTVVNHQAETDFMMRAAALELGEDAVGAGKLVMASDDMSLFSRRVPDAISAWGSASPTAVPDLTTRPSSR